MKQKHDCLERARRRREALAEAEWLPKERRKIVISKAVAGTRLKNQLADRDWDWRQNKKSSYLERQANKLLAETGFFGSGWRQKD